MPGHESAPNEYEDGVDVVSQGRNEVRDFKLGTLKAAVEQNRALSECLIPNQSNETANYSTRMRHRVAGGVDF